MPSFQEAFPERMAAAPTLQGESTLPANLITPRLRRVQLVNLAKAYGLAINPEATKNQILPTMVGAEQQGVFRGQASDPEALRMALKDPDVREPEPMLPPVLPQSPAKAEEEPKGPPLILLKKLCSQKGINTKGMKMAEMANALAEVIGNEQRERQAGGDGPSEGEASGDRQVAASPDSPIVGQDSPGFSQTG